MPDESFSFRSIIKPGQGAQQAVQRFIEAKAAKFRFPEGGDWYSCVEEMILKHGEAFTGAHLPDAYKGDVGPATHCHKNALAAALAHPELRLFTGFYSVSVEVHEHSWCVDPDGKVVELTYPVENAEGKFMAKGEHVTMPWQAPEHWAYHGLELDASFVKAFEDRTGCLPALFADDPTHKKWVKMALASPYKLSGWELPTVQAVQEAEEEDRAAMELRMASYGGDEDDDDWGDDEDNPEEPEYA